MRSPDIEAIDPKYTKFLKERAQEVGSVLESVPIFNIEDLINNFDESKISPMYGGSKSRIFRIDGIIPDKPATLKIVTIDEFDYFFSLDDPDEIFDEAYYGYQGAKTIQAARDVCLSGRYGEGTDLALRQIWGHAIGHLRKPEHVDPPAGIWVSYNQGEEAPVVIGYSLPFIEGTPITIESDLELVLAADQLKTEGLYVGHRRDSLNAVVNPQNGTKKLIDVEVRF